MQKSLRVGLGLCVAASLGAFAADTTVSQQEVATTTGKSATRSYSYDIKDPCYFTTDCYTVPVGSADINSDRLAPYHAIWTQDVPKDGAWVRAPSTYEETLSVGDDGNWVHVQTNHLGNGMAQVGVRRLDRKTLQILDLTLSFINAPPGQPEQVFYDMTGNSFAAEITLPDGNMTSGQPRDLALPMFDGQIAGLTLAALPLKEGYVATLPMVIPNLGIYWIEASVVARKKINSAAGDKIDVWEVNANWLNLTDGDVYEPGRDGSGGVYYIAVNPGDGVPPVIEYVNDGGIIAWDGVRRNK